MNPYLKYAPGGPVDPEEPEKAKSYFKKGYNTTKLNAFDEMRFQIWRSSLPKNLQSDTDEYDLRGAYKSGMEPEYVDEDKSYHLFSIDPTTGRYLKAQYHPTFDYALDSDIKAGYVPYSDVKTQQAYVGEKMYSSGGEANPFLQARSGIYIKPENRGKFTAWANEHDMGVQEAANTVMSNKEKYSPGVVKMANFAKNAAGWKKHAYGGPIDPEEPALPAAPTTMFSNYNPMSKDYEAAMSGMMKARMATAAELGNTGAKRMTSVSPQTYTFTGNEEVFGQKEGIPAGETGTHYMMSDGNYVVPIIQRGPNGLMFNSNPYYKDKEAMRFESEQDAQYFSENYKSVAPMMYMQKQMAYGGEAEMVPVEIERNERVYDKQGNLLMETSPTDPTHEQGGVKLELPAGSLVFPKQYHAALDKIKTLPGFKKIAERMLENANNAYLRGEKYSSGGKQ
jgi:hypothetical protein